ncbi:MAG: hypothetical protein RIR81_480, partial [Actinomycetota bacterium]
NAFSNRSNLTMLFGQDCENTVNLTQLVGAENDSLIAVVRHCKSIAEANAKSTQASCEPLYSRRK